MKKYIITLCLIASFAMQSSAQNAVAIEKAICTIDNYLSDVIMSDEESFNFFIDLFTSPNAKVTNDLIGTESLGTTVTAETFGQTVMTKTKNLQMFVSNLYVDECTQVDGNWIVKISFNRSIEYLNPCGVHYATKDWYDNDLKVLFTLVYDEDSDQCLIESITSNIDEKKNIGDTYVVFKKTDPRDVKLRVGSELIKFNDYDQAFLKKPVSEKSFKYPDVDMYCKVNIDEACNIITSQYKTRRMRVSVNTDFSMGKPFTLEGNSLVNVDKQSSFGLGVDFGYNLPIKGAFKLGLYTGLGYTSNTIDLSLSDYKTSFTTDQDVDHDTYKRYYENVNIVQSVKFSELNVPLYLDMSVALGNVVSLYFDGGVIGHLNMSNSIDVTQGSGYVYGVYPQYDNLLLDEHWGYNGFGDLNLTNANLSENKVPNIKSFYADLLLGGGLRFSIPQTPVAIEAGFRYQSSLMEIVSNSGDRASVGGDVSYNSSILKNTIRNTESVEVMRSLTDVFSSIKRNALNMHLSIIYKF